MQVHHLVVGQLLRDLPTAAYRTALLGQMVRWTPETTERSLDLAEIPSKWFPNSAEGEDEDPLFTNEELPSVSPLPTFVRRLLKLIACSLVVALVYFMIFQRESISSALSAVLGFMVANPYPGFIIFVALYIFNAVLTLPVFILVLGAGYVGARTFGSIAGIGFASTEVFVASIISSTVAFFIGRSCCLGHVKLWTSRSKKLQMLESLMKVQGLRVALMLRLASILPFGTLNYTMAVLGMSYQSFLLGSIGLLPYIITYVTIGASLDSIQHVLAGDTNGSQAKTAMLISGSIFTFIASLYISIMARRTLNELHCEERRRSSIAAIQQSQLPKLGIVQHQTPAAEHDVSESVPDRSAMSAFFPPIRSLNRTFSSSKYSEIRP